MNPMVVIGIPLYGDGKEQFWNCLEKMRWYSAKHGVDTVRQTMKCCYIHHNRNLIVVATQKHWQGASHILWLDTDIYFEPDLLLRLLVHKKPIVCTNYYRKAPPCLPVATSRDREGVLRPVYQDPDKSGLEGVDGSGLGACLTRVKIFEKIKFPWFENSYREPPPGVADKDLVCGKILIGEDVYFFRKAKWAGLKVYCDFSAKIGHIGDYIYDWRDHERNQGHHACQGSKVCGQRDQ